MGNSLIQLIESLSPIGNPYNRKHDKVQMLNVVLLPGFRVT